jgi:TonB family protein
VSFPPVITEGTSPDAPPTLLSSPLDINAYYPPKALVQVTQGHVWTRVCIYSTGDIASVSLMQSSGDQELDGAALTIARQTRWKAAIANGKPVTRCRPFRVDFSLAHSRSG